MIGPILTGARVPVVMSLWEPWSTLVAIGAKRIETRGWDTSYRGPVAIQSTKGGLGKHDLYDTCTNPHFITALRDFAPDYRFAHGYIIAVGNLADCLPVESTGCLPGVFDDYPELDTPQERAFGNYAPGRYGFVFDRVFRLPRAIHFKSRQGKLLPLDLITEALIREHWKGFS